MPASVDWTALTVPGAFLIGAALATIATLRIVRYVTEYFARRGKEDTRD